MVDNGSTDNTLGVAKKFKQRYPKLIQFLVEDRVRSSYAARNKGIQSSKGSIIAFIDADMTVDEDWLNKISAAMEDNSKNYLACNVEKYLDRYSLTGLYNQITDFPVKQFIHHGHFAPTCCLVIRKNLLEKVGLFDPRMVSSGDLEFGNRVYRAGYTLYYEPDIIMRHPARSSLKQIFRKYFRIGRGQRQLVNFYPNYYPKRNILNPRSYLPSKIWENGDQTQLRRIWYEVSLRKRIFFLFVSWLIKLADQAGYIYEK